MTMVGMKPRGDLIQLYEFVDGIRSWGAKLSSANKNGANDTWGKAG
jgi:hypothetical protein